MNIGFHKIVYVTMNSTNFLLTSYPVLHIGTEKMNPVSPQLKIRLNEDIHRCFDSIEESWSIS